LKKYWPKKIRRQNMRNVFFEAGGADHGESPKNIRLLKM